MTRPSPTDRRGARLAGLLSFSAFFVFPAIPFGTTLGLTVPYVLAASIVAVWLWRLTTSDWAPFAWVMAPVAISGAYVLLVGGALAPDVVPKTIVILAITSLIAVPTRHLLRSGHGEPFILGAALAILVHAAAGAYQVLAFERGRFPFADLMSTNPSMAMPADVMETYAAYVKRPFGLFAEPSAMGACVGPWLVLISTVLFAPAAEGSRRHRAILALALGSGLALVVGSRTGLAVPIAGAAAVPGVVAAFSSRRGAVARVAALLIGAGIVGATAMWLTSNAASQFVTQNDSWHARFESLKLAVHSMESSRNVLLGVGPGQSYATVTSTDLRVPGVTAVWSITLTYAMETGAVGIASMLVMGLSIALAIWASRARLAGAACATVWLFGLLFGTTYSQQPALWAAMAMLLSWQSVTGRRTDWQRELVPRDRLAAQTS